MEYIAGIITGILLSIVAILSNNIKTPDIKAMYRNTFTDKKAIIIKPDNSLDGII